jgi:hypothetical protein
VTASTRCSGTLLGFHNSGLDPAQSAGGSPVAGFAQLVNNMTSWPWMKGIDVALADPIDPVVAEDSRESVKELIAKNEAYIEKLRDGLKDDPLYDPSKHDDLWILRFVLSHKKTKPALAAAKHTLLFRQQYNLDAEDIRTKDPHKLTEGNVYEYWKHRCKGDAILTTHPDPKRGIVMFLTFAEFDPKATAVVSEEAWDDAFIYASEFCHQWLDYTTRTTGRLTKSIRLIDTRGVSMKVLLDRKSNQRDGKVMGKMEDCYPQLLETIFICFPPRYVGRLVRSFGITICLRVCQRVARNILVPARFVDLR